jgi:predicted deacylase
VKETILSIQSPLGPSIELTQFIWEGTQPKNTVSIVSGIQGNHLNGIYLCSRLVRFLNSVESGKESGYYLKGVIKIIPATNLPAIQEGTSLWSLNDLDMDLAFPGNDQGEVTEQITASVCRHTKDSQFGIILQSADTHYNDAPHLFCLNPDGIAKDFARSLGPQNIREPKTSSTFRLSLYSHWADQMITSVILSAGKSNHLDISLCETMLPGLINSLLWTGVLGNDRKKPIKYQLKFNRQNKERFISSHAGGFFLPTVKLGSEIKKGQKIGDIVDIHSNTILESILADSSGYLVTLRNHSIIYQREVLAVLLEKPKLRFWPVK